MASDFDNRAQNTDRAKRLPFEPIRLKKTDRPSSNSSKANDRRSASSGKPDRANSLAKPTRPARSAQAAPKTEPSAYSAAARPDTSIPEVVSRRMLSRMAVLCGVPTLMAIILFLVSYQVVIHHWLNIPNIAVVLVSMGCFGLGVIGLTYGALSASWEESEPGSLLGWSEFQTNVGRMTAAWREAGEKRAE